MSMLDAAREWAGVPFVITSGARTPEQNAAAGGVENSAHGRGLAVDLSCTTSRHRWRMVAGLLKAGFQRIGVYNRHVHADCDITLPQEVMWWGESH